MLVDHAWDRKFGEPLPTLEDVMAEASQDDDDYVSIGWGKYKEKDSVDDPTAPTFKKDDSGTFVPAKGADKEKPSKEPKGDEEKPKSKGSDASDYERDFDDSEPEDKPFGGDTGRDADSETGKDYVSKFQGTDEPKEFEKGAKVTASWKGLSGKQQEIPDGEIEDVIYTDRGTEYVIRWNNGNNLIQLPADSVEGEEPKEKRSGGKKEETIIINGKKYHPIKEKNNG